MSRTLRGLTAIRESPRDINETAFTPALRILLHTVPEALAVAFIDYEGECIDYCASIPPFDAKVSAAHLHVIASGAVGALDKLGAGTLAMMHVHCDERDLFVRRISDEYTLVVVTRSLGLTRILHHALEDAVRALRKEAEIETPPWELTREPLRVEVRESKVRWNAPAAFWECGERVEIDDVMGRWAEREIDEHGSERDLECFLVRSTDGHETTLVHDTLTDHWERR